MKWILIIVVYAACAEPVLTNTGKEFDTEEACVEWAKAHKSQLGVSAEMQIQCTLKR